MIKQRKTMSHSEAMGQAKALLKQMTLSEKVGQVNQRLYGFNAYEKVLIDNQSEFVLTEEFKEEVDKYSGLGVLYGLYRADPWSKKDFETGIRRQEAIKVYNMVQAYVVENSRLGIPMLLSTECPHGHQALDGYLLPVNLSMGATFNPELVGKAYDLCGQEMVDMGVDFALISLLDILRDPRWGRSEECFGEDPYLASEMSKEIVKAVQNQGVYVVAKHFCAQGEGTGGINASAARIGERELREIHTPAMEACCQVGVKGVMAAYNEIDGVPCHSNQWLLDKVLKKDMGFDGVVMADGIAIDRLDVMTGDNVASGAKALEAGIDISLWDSAFSRLEEAIERDPKLEESLDQAVLKVLTMKYERGLFDMPYLTEEVTNVIETSDPSLSLARESVVLLKNKNQILPLSFDKYKKIAVIGPNGNDLYNQLGDYSPYVNKEECTTVFEGLQLMAEEYNLKNQSDIIIRYEKGCDLLEETCGNPLLKGRESEHNPVKADTDFQKAIELAEDSDLIILALGGSSSRFGQVSFDTNGAAIQGSMMDCGEGFDVSDLQLPGRQLELAKALAKTGKAMVAVMIEGRPYSCHQLADLVDGLFVSFYPGPKGGQAIAELLLGKVNPSGCLPVSIAESAGQLPVYYNYKTSYQAMDYYNLDKKLQYQFGDGLSYTSFDYDDFKVLVNEEDVSIKVTFKIKNLGPMDGFALPQLYIQQLQSATIRRVKELKGFQKIFVRKEEEACVTLELGKNELSVWNGNFEKVVESSEFVLTVKDGIEQRWQSKILLKV